MIEKIFDRVALLVIDSDTNTYTRYLGGRKTGRWQAETPLQSWEVEALRKDPHRYFGESESPSTA